MSAGRWLYAERPFLAFDNHEIPDSTHHFLSVCNHFSSHFLLSLCKSSRTIPLVGNRWLYTAGSIRRFVGLSMIRSSRRFHVLNLQLWSITSTQTTLVLGGGLDHGMSLIFIWRPVLKFSQCLVPEFSIST